MTVQNTVAANETGIVSFPRVTAILETCSVANPASELLPKLAAAFGQLSWQLKQTSLTSESCISAVDANGVEVSNNAEEWLRREVKAGRSPASLLEQVAKSRLTFSKREGALIYAVGADPSSNVDFFQIRIIQQVQLTGPTLEIDPWAGRGSEYAFIFAWDNAERSQPRYVCREADIVHSLTWLEKCRKSHRAIRENQLSRLKQRSVRTMFGDGTQGSAGPFSEAHPFPDGWTDEPSRQERWFEDWKTSSAGEKNMGRFWYLQTQEYEMDDQLVCEFIPQALPWPKQRVEAKGRSCFLLMDKLERFDRSIRCPFVWFFFMVHGNRVTDEAGQVIVDGIRDGRIHLPPFDEGVLMKWAATPYRF